MKLYEFIQAHRPEILTACLAKMREVYKVESEAELLNGVPGFLDVLVGALRRDAGAEAADTPAESDARAGAEANAAASSAVKRKTHGFEITRVVNDYGVVCDQVNGLASKENLDFSAREAQVMNLMIDKATATGVEAFLAATSDAERHDRAEQFGALAHEIRNAANAATLAFSLISQGKVAASGKTAEVLRRALSRIDSLVANALTEAQLSGSAPLNKERLRLADICAGAVALALPDRGVRIQVEVDPSVYVEGDERLLTSAVSNLLQNAVKFTRDDGVIVIRGRADPSQSVTIVEVEDCCGGLPEGRTEELFKPFVKTGNKNWHGAGLGLHIVRRAVEAHGGGVKVRNLPGVGCIFAINLPFSGGFQA